MDSGATNHMTCYKSWLVNENDKAIASKHVHMLNGHSCQVTHIGNVLLDSMIELQNVLVAQTSYTI